MIKRTLCFNNPAYLSLKNKQLVIKLNFADNPNLTQALRDSATKTVPIEDIGIVILDHSQITITQNALVALLENNCAVITCDLRHMPIGLQLPLETNTLQSERFHNQIEASLPLKKQLWQQTMEYKINNQAAALEYLTGNNAKNMRTWANNIKSGDRDNLEGRAAVYYWANIFPNIPNFTRDREGIPPNNLLNYGYAILRAIVARNLVASGLLPTFGIHHHNRYNAYCLADDIMEPYRPFVDILVAELMEKFGSNIEEITPEHKYKLLTIATIDVFINSQKSPLMIGVSQTTASLYKCFSGEYRKIAYPDLAKTLNK